MQIRDLNSESAHLRTLDGLGERIGKVADILGSRKEAAEAAGITPSSMQRYIAGQNTPGFDVCARLCAKARVRMEWLAFGESPMHEQESYVISPREQSQGARQNAGQIDMGMLGVAIRIADEVLKKYELRDQLSSEQFADLARLVLNDLARGAAEDAATASLGRILAIARKS